MPGLLRRFLEKALHVLQAGQGQVAPVQVIKPHPVLPCQHIGTKIARQGLVEKFSVSPPSVHGQLVQMRGLNLSGFSGRRLHRCRGNVLGVGQGGKNKRNKQKTGTHGLVLF